MGRFLILAAFVLLSAIAQNSLMFAADEDLLTQGETLFNTKEGLGVKIACITCHKADKAITKGQVAGLGDQLPDSINKYITEKSKGTALDKNSQEMKALETYIRDKHSV